MNGIRTVEKAFQVLFPILREPNTGMAHFDVLKYILHLSDRVYDYSRPQSAINIII